MKISIYPSYRKNKKQGNPFINNLYDCFPPDAEVQYVYGKNQEGLFHNLFKSNVYVMNWPENVIHDTLGFLQIFVFIAFIHIILIRGSKIVWILHNIEPHEGHNWYSRYIYGFMMRHSLLILSFSTKGTIYLKDKTSAVIKYYPHPFKSDGRSCNRTDKKWDLYIWGSINKYKGVIEFLNFLAKKNYLDKYNILITGKCNDWILDNKIKEYSSKNIEYINDYLSTDSLINNIDNSHYVLFPYIENSVSSSGALMDSLEYGANVIGPDVGAFHDAKNEGIALTYSTYNDIIKILEEKTRIDCSKINKFVIDNSWKKFGSRFYKDIESAYHDISTKI